MTLIIPLDHVASVTFLNKVRLSILFYESSKHVSVFLIVSDDGLVPLLALICITLQLRGVGEGEVGAEDVDVLPGEEEVGVDGDRGAEEEIVLLAAELLHVLT